MTSERPTTRETKPKEAPGSEANKAQEKQPRVVSRPQDVASLVLMQIDAVNSKKDELTIAIKGLSDLSKQLVRAYGENAQQIQELRSALKERDGNGKGTISGS